MKSAVFMSFVIFFSNLLCLSHSDPIFLLGIGTQKSATTSLFAFLKERVKTDLVFPRKNSKKRKKELHFFDKFFDDHHRSTALAKYLENWDITYQAEDYQAEDSILFEFTPGYFRSPATPSRIRQTFSEPEKLRFILLLRDPVDRAISAYGMQVGHGNLPTENTLSEFWRVAVRERRMFNSCVKKKKAAGALKGRLAPRIFSYSSKSHAICKSITFQARVLCKTEGAVMGFAWGLYYESLQHWLCSGFAPEQFFIAHYDDVIRDPEAVVESMAEFLGRKWTFNQESRELPHSNSWATDERLPPDRRAQLETFFDVSNRQLQQLLIKEAFHVFNQSSFFK